jgi:hypothetical protein
VHLPGPRGFEGSVQICVDPLVRLGALSQGLQEGQRRRVFLAVGIGNIP